MCVVTFPHCSASLEGQGAPLCSHLYPGPRAAEIVLTPVPLVPRLQRLCSRLYPWSQDCTAVLMPVTLVQGLQRLCSHLYQSCTTVLTPVLSHPSFWSPEECQREHFMSTLPFKELLGSPGRVLLLQE